MSTMQELPPALGGRDALPAVPEQPRLRLVPDVPLDFDDAVRRLTPRLQRYAARRLGDVHEAEELVQEALLRAYRQRDTLLTEDDLAAWTTVVTGRLVIDRLRVRNRSVNVAEVPEGSRVGRDTADVVVARDEARLALDALDAMPARQAAVLWAREVEGQAYDEIGQRFGMTEPAVRSILTRARKALRKEYAIRGGTLPVAGLSALAPWVTGLRLVDRLRGAATRIAAPTALGLAGVGLLGGALTTPWAQHGAGAANGAAPAAAAAVRAASVTAAVVHDPAPARTRAARPAARPGAARSATYVPTRLDRGPLGRTCVSDVAGAEGCTRPGRTGDSTLYVGPTLPDNPTGVRDVGVKSSKIDCSAVPTLPALTCTPSNGGTR
jgi:RNA polymerase sigma-70 factor (ECF subfamily)